MIVRIFIWKFFLLNGSCKLAQVLSSCILFYRVAGSTDLFYFLGRFSDLLFRTLAKQLNGLLGIHVKFWDYEVIRINNTYSFNYMSICLPSLRRLDWSSLKDEVVFSSSFDFYLIRDYVCFSCVTCRVEIIHKVKIIQMISVNHLHLSEILCKVVPPLLWKFWMT